LSTLVADGRRASYEDQGAGRVVLLIHGSPGSARVWTPVAERLARQFRVVAPDLPGHGETTPQPEGQEPDVGYAREIIEGLIRHVGAPVVLAGHSYGGVVALAVALRATDPVRALALFEPVALNALAMLDERSHATARAHFADYIQGFGGAGSRMMPSRRRAVRHSRSVTSSIARYGRLTRSRSWT
jgi:pimeloyl-ACP methyl ester carboxylesterase